jgi:hypothetical protein
MGSGGEERAKGTFAGLVGLGARKTPFAMKQRSVTECAEMLFAVLSILITLLLLFVLACLTYRAYPFVFGIALPPLVLS